MAGERQVTRIHDIEGFRKHLKTLDKKWDSDFLKIANKKAAELVAEDAQSKFRSLPGPGAKVAPTVKALSSARAAKVSMGGARTPFAMGVEFGGGLHGKGNPTSGGGYTTQFQPHRGSGAGAGYALYPAIRKNRERIVETYRHTLFELASEAFPN